MSAPKQFSVFLPIVDWVNAFSLTIDADFKNGNRCHFAGIDSLPIAKLQVNFRRSIGLIRPLVPTVSATVDMENSHENSNPDAGEGPHPYPER